jgi:hypothetical protein
MSGHTIELIVGIASVTLFVATVTAIPWLVRRLPQDYFVRQRPKKSLPMRLARNVGGLTLIALGVAMLILPGPGIVAILMGLVVIDLPVKHRMLKRILKNEKIQERLQRLRSKKGKPPLVIPAT